jgi:hypothetical protein
MIPEPPGAWALQAECAGMDPALFFPERGESTSEAKAVCRRCPVAAECLAYGMANRERFGIWGGKSERERRALRRGGRAPTYPVATEADIVRLYAEGWTQVDLADEYGIGQSTVSDILHRARGAA